MSLTWLCVLRFALILLETFTIDCFDSMSACFCFFIYILVIVGALLLSPMKVRTVHLLGLNVAPKHLDLLLTHY